MLERTTRREFLTKTLFLTVGGYIPIVRRGLADAEDRKSPCLKGFIITEVPLGLQDSPPLSTEQLDEQTRLILESFPDLDVIIDARDVCYTKVDSGRTAGSGYVTSEVWEGMPLLCTLGRHPMMHRVGEEDRGDTSDEFYYGVSVKGIHLVLIPMDGEHGITKDVLHWLKLDLNVHRDETTIICSYSKKNDAERWSRDPNGSNVISAEWISQLLNENPQIIAWICGYYPREVMFSPWQEQVVIMDRDRDAVSDGILREGTIGGMYFEVGSDFILLRGWNGEKRRFLDMLSPRSRSLMYGRQITTSFDPSKEVSLSYGLGLSSRAEEVCVYRGLWEKGLTASVYLMGAEGFQNTGDGNSCFPGKRNMARVGVIAPNRWENRYPCFATEPGANYTARLRVYADSGGTEVAIVWRVYDGMGKMLEERVSQRYRLSEGHNDINSHFEVPDVFEEEPNTTTGRMWVSAEAVFTHTGEGVRVEHWQIVKGDVADTKNPGVVIQGHEYRYAGVLKAGEITRMDIPTIKGSRFVIGTVTEGQGRLSYLIQERGLRQPSQHMTVSLRRDSVVLGPMSSIV